MNYWLGWTLKTSGLQDVKFRGGTHRLSVGSSTSQVEVVKKEKNPYVAANGTRKPRTYR